MKRLTLGVMLLALGLVLTACSAVIDSEGAKIGNPADFAQATHIAQMSDAAAISTRTAVDIITTRQVESIHASATEQAARVNAAATASAIDHQALQARADKVKAGAAVVVAQAETEQRAQGAALAGKSTLYFFGYVGVGVGTLVLFVGVAFGIVALVNKRATSVYPNAQGQFPIITKRGPGWVAFHDPNRGLGPGAVIRTPGLIERAAYGWALAHGKALALEPGAMYPQTAGEGAMVQIGVGAQLVQHEVAKQSGRPKVLFGVGSGAQTSATASREKHDTPRLPMITVVNDPAQIKAFEQRLLGEGGEE